MDTTQENPNSPDNLLGNWLRSNISNMRDLGHGPMEEVADLLLSHILDFADDHNKLDEMFSWLCSVEGDKFLSQKEFSPFGSELNYALERLDTAFSDHCYELQASGVTKEIIDQDETWVSFIYDFINQHDEPLRYSLHLK